MNIGILTRFLSIGENWDSGIGQHFRILADELSSRGHSVRVFLLCHVDEKKGYEEAYSSLNPGWNLTVVGCKTLWFDWVKKKSWPLYQLLFHLKSAWIGRKALLNCHKASPLDICETHSYYLPHLFVQYSRRPPKIVIRVSTLQLQIVRESPLSSRVLHLESAIERFVINRGQYLVTHAKGHLKLLCMELTKKSEDFFIVTHAVRDPRSRNQLSAKSSGTVFLFVGRFEFRKGIDVLLNAIPIVTSHVTDVRFILAGSRGDGSQWNEFTRSYPDIAERFVESLGRVSEENLKRLYQECDVFVAPSRYESFGLIYAEAMSYGKPSIGCTVGGVPDVISDGSTGMLVPPGDSQALANAILYFAQNKRLIHEFGVSARADYLARFTPHALALNSEMMYSSIIGTDAGKSVR